MINLEKEEFCFRYINENYNKKNLVYSCYKDLFEEKKKARYIVNFIKYDTNMIVTIHIIYHIIYSKKEIPCDYNPLWRTVLPSLQKGNKVDTPIVTPVVKSFTESTQNTTAIQQRMPKKLPNDYVRQSHNFKEKRYHESLKNYTFDYPWHELDIDGVPRPALVGKSHDDRLQWALDIEKYDIIKDSYVMPDELKEFRQKHPSVFSGYLKDGFPHNRGGYHPNEEIFNS